MAVDERRRIIDAADAALAATQGEAVSVSEILAAAGLSTRAFYRHFAGKDALLLALFRQETEAMQARLQAAVDAAAEPPEQLRAWIEEFLKVASAPRRRQRAHLFAAGEISRARGYAEEKARMRAVQEQSLAAILARGLRDGSLPWASPASDARAIRAAIDRAFDDQISGIATVSAAEAADEVVGFALRALGVPVRDHVGHG